jgi:2-hydroxy-6-oxonona-2,4-dienedioate hydrolase
MVTRRTLFTVGGVVAGALVAGGAATGLGYAAAIDAARKRTATGSSVIDTTFGALEYAEAGNGQPLLMIHGTGGGFDQGLAFCRPLMETGYRIIAPSRFGYLRSDYPEDPSSENQADVLVELLDYLGIDKLPVAGGSAGALPAIEFAIRHPDRCSALIAIVPASYVPDRPATPGPSGFQNTAMNAMLNSDFIFWAALNAMPDLMIGTMLATDPALVPAATAAERDRVVRILWDILPVSARTRGLLNDARLASNPAKMDIERVAAPTLAISLEDDRFGTAAAARHLAATIPGAKLVIYPTGGHVWVGHDTELFGEVDRFVSSLA